MTELSTTETSNVVFSEGSSEVIRIDAKGFHYRGQFVDDAGEAHRLLVAFLRKHQPSVGWADADQPVTQ